MKYDGCLLYLAALLFAVITVSGCGGPDLINTADLPDNNYCRHMKEICKEARDFENAYQKMSREERKEAESVLKAYRIQCNDAYNECRKSAR